MKKKLCIFNNQNILTDIRTPTLNPKHEIDNKLSSAYLYNPRTSVLIDDDIFNEVPEGHTLQKDGDKILLVKDMRGSVIWEKATMRKGLIDYIGELKPEHTQQEPDNEFVFWDQVEEKWEEDEWARSEELRRRLQKKRAVSLLAMTHDFGDGRVIQVRPDDIPNINIAITQNYSGDWVMADDKVYEGSSDDLEDALAAGILKGEAIWQEYMDKLKVIVSHETA